MVIEPFILVLFENAPFWRDSRLRGNDELATGITVLDLTPLAPLSGGNTEIVCIFYTLSTLCYEKQGSSAILLI